METQILWSAPPEAPLAASMARIVVAALRQALAADTDPASPILAISGMSGRRYRLFINNLISRLPEASYLEIGVWKGSTLCAAIAGNRVRAVAIDDWSQFGGPREACLANLARLKGSGADVLVLDRDFRGVDYSTLGLFDVFLFDGPHGFQDQVDGLTLARPALKSPCVLIIDDWNWRRVREGTRKGLSLAGLDVAWQAEVRTTSDDTHPAVHSKASDWHNGYFIAVVVNAVN